jgi:hypothetical protein
VLDLLGLPTQTLDYSTTPSQLLTTATSVRAGDQFEVRTSAGAQPATVTIDANDTPDTLAEKISQAAGFNVTVQIVDLNGQNELQITPANGHSTVELLPGPAGEDALTSLGLTAGVIQTPSSLDAGSVASSSPSGIAQNTYGLNLPASFDLTTTAGIQAAQTAIKAAMAKVQTAYYGLTNPTSTSTSTSAIKNNSANNPVPAYLQAELSNYQAGLVRLTGSTSTSSGLSALL